MPDDRGFRPAGSLTKPFKPVKPSTNPQERTAPPRREPSPEREAGIPTQLVSRIAKEFVSDDTKISSAAEAALGEYLKTFVREAIWRAAAESRPGELGFLEVEDLEKLAPQLLLDF